MITSQTNFGDFRRGEMNEKKCQTRQTPQRECTCFRYPNTRFQWIANSHGFIPRAMIEILRKRNFRKENLHGHQNNRPHRDGNTRIHTHV